MRLWPATRNTQLERGRPAEEGQSSDLSASTTPERPGRGTIGVLAEDDHAPSPQDDRAARSIRIQHGKGWAATLPDLWEYRETMFFLVWRDLKVRYRQTFFGVLWGLVQPLGLMLLFAVFAGRVLDVGAHGAPYAVFAFAALVPWTLISQTFAAGAESLVKNASLVSKSYFPRLIIPFAAAMSFLLDFVIAFAVLFLLMAYYSVYPSPIAIVAIPFFTILGFAIAVAVGVFASALNVMYRDVRAAIPFLTQLWLFASPIAYSTQLIPEKWRLLYAINPVVSVVDGFRWALLGESAPSIGTVAVSTAATAVVFLAALTYFRHVERIFADVI